jgi:hypothetical protein
MESGIFFTFLGVFALSLCCNTATLVYIISNFEIKTHVFTLLFLDVLFSTLCSGICVVLDLMVVSGLMNINFTYCTFSFLSLYLPSCYGAGITLAVAAIRYVLTRKSAQNKKVSNFKVSLISLLSLLILFILTLGFLVYNIRCQFHHFHCYQKQVHLKVKITIFGFQTVKLFGAKVSDEI